MNSGIRSPNLPLGTTLGEFLGNEIVGGTRSLKRYSRVSVIGPLEAIASGSQIGGGVVFSSKAEADAHLGYAAFQLALVTGDGDPAKNGLYQKIAGTGTGLWSRIADLPYEIVQLTVTGGTGDAILASFSPQVPSTPGDKLYLMVPTANNTGVAMTINGAVVKNALNSTPAANSFVSGVTTSMIWAGDHYQLLTSLSADTAGVVADATAARDLAAASATAAASSASALANQVHQYDTRAQAIAATIPAGVNLARLLGRVAAGDLFGSGALHKKLGGAPSPARSWHFQSADSAWWQLKEFRVNPRMFGAVGDGVADDRAAVQDAIDFISALTTGGTVEGVPGDTYRIVINSGVTDNGVILKSGVNLIGNRAKLRLECDGQVYGIRPLSNTKIIGWDIKTSVSTGLSATIGAEQGIWHAPISIGAAYGNCGTVGSVSAYAIAQGMEIAWNTIDSARNNGQGLLVGGYGAVGQIHIHHNTIPDNSTIALAIGFDWAFVGTLSSADINGSKTNYNNGTSYSIHPHDLLIEHNFIGKMTMALYAGPFGSHGIRLSGVYNSRVIGNEIAETTYAGIFVTGGDLSFEFAPTKERYMAMKNIVVEGNVMQQCNTYYGIYYEAYPDNVFEAASNPANSQYPYSPIGVVDGYPVGTRIVGNAMVASGGGYLGEGIYVQFSRGGLVSDNSVQGFKTGIRAGRGASETVIERNQVTLANEAGILISDSSSPSPTGVTVRNNKSSRNCASGGTQGNISVDSAIRTSILGNLIGSTDEDNSSIGLSVTANATAISVVGNRVKKVKTGGTAYKIASSSVTTALYVFRDNEYEGSDTYFSGIEIVPINRFGLNGSGQNGHYVANRTPGISSARPAFGTYVANDIVDINGAASAEAVRILCTVSGSPGTWAVVSTRP
ncbi:right-handed parallel beta-helix repeat-containing protein [Bradyrhizobium sp. 144]|uniref:right-handed parallel beta-helix repeat-containing protein n=1 Tax=Bradyrhizobium sp. 144 TaxID=2782620 RepID=UPI001FF9971F|nr:right-handed parallel beta-helix repeat-containing protein [Bradyrhizobium sp. 144]MCK1693741.1 right-handed parallel beta-helix repeat-containing protein [Bradyrhizobium sp. 144]